MSDRHDKNPFRSPLSEELEPADLDYEPNGKLVSSGWLYRKVHIFEPIDAMIEYSARLPGFDQVKLNGRVAQRILIWFWFATRFDFSVPTSQGPVRVQIDLSVNLRTQITRFAIAAGDRVVYREPGE